MAGPLTSLRVVEFAGLGPAPLAGQLLADQGADVVVIDRASAPADPTDINRRGKRSIALDLKADAGRDVAMKLIDKADVLIEGFRPGVMEKLGLGPDDCHDRLIYGRMTGWGQEGPLARRAGHDINYLALTGALHMIGPQDGPPIPPLNLVADFGGGTMFLLFGLLSALFERGLSGKGQVVDAAMIDGVPAMMGLLHQSWAQGTWEAGRARNLLDGGAPFYRCYTCACGEAIAVGALEPQFFAELVERAGLSDVASTDQTDRAAWGDMTAAYAAVFVQKTRAEWAEIFDGSDACVAPVLRFDEAPDHPHNVARDAFFEEGGVVQAVPAPRFSRTSPRRPKPPRAPGGDGDGVLADLGFGADDILALRQRGIVR